MSCKSIKLNSKGITLTELIVTLAIIGIIMIPIGSIFYTGFSSFFESSEELDAKNKIRDIADLIISDLRKNQSSENTPDIPDNGYTLKISNTVAYKYDAEKKTLTKTINGTNTVTYDKIESFNATKNGSLIVFEIKTKTKNGQEISIKNSFTLRIK